MKKMKNKQTTKVNEQKPIKQCEGGTGKSKNGNREVMNSKHINKPQAANKKKMQGAPNKRNNSDKQRVTNNQITKKANYW